jgi:hypothetical protein
MSRDFKRGTGGYHVSLVERRRNGLTIIRGPDREF